MNQKGQSLIEALIALGAAALIVSAISVAVITAVNSADYSKYENQATHLAQQGIEVLKQSSQANWNAFNADSNLATHCLNSSNQFSAEFNCPLDLSVDPNISPNFMRQVDLMRDSGCGANDIYGKVDVYWNDGRCKSPSYYCHKVELDSCFADINKVTPL